MSNETTQLQKAIKIAVKDGWVETDPINGIRMFYKDFHLKEVLFFFAKYTTDLNYLMPIASRILKDLVTNMMSQNKSTDNLREAKSNAYCDLQDAYNALKLDTNNQYTELFESLYEAVKLLGDE
jgi:hypothetical protein